MNEICLRSERLNTQDFFLMVVEELVLSRDFAVATRRYDGQMIRLRITGRESGLVALVSLNRDNRGVLRQSDERAFTHGRLRDDSEGRRSIHPPLGNGEVLRIPNHGQQRLPIHLPSSAKFGWFSA
jgi:hypothetical protein